MIKYHIEDENNRIVTVDSFPDNEKCWIQLIDPTDDELREITMRFDLPMEACRAALDLDERSRIDIDDHYRMLLVNIHDDSFVDDPRRQRDNHDLPEGHAYPARLF